MGLKIGGIAARLSMLWAVAAASAGWVGEQAYGAEFPRLAGYNVGAKNYDDAAYQQQLARLDLVILGFYKGWKPDYGIGTVLANLKALASPRNILVGQYTILNEAPLDPKDVATQDIQNKLNEEDWWARNANGQMVQWTSAYNTWDINFTVWSHPDENGQRWPQWRPDRDYQLYFQPYPFDIWFVDNVWSQPRVTADWNLDGKNDTSSDPVIAAGYRAGHRAEWDHIRAIAPTVMLLGNAGGNNLSFPEYAGQLDGALLEAAMGESWSVEAWAGWTAMMQRYRGLMANTRPPHLVVFNVHGSPTNYQFFRYAYASCLLDDGYFSFSDISVGYSSVPWFDEYDHKLGAPLTAPPTAAWQNGVWRRDFQLGIVLVNPSLTAVTVALEPGFHRFTGIQAPSINNGGATTSVTLAPKDGIVLLRQ